MNSVSALPLKLHPKQLEVRSLWVPRNQAIPSELRRIAWWKAGQGKSRLAIGIAGALNCDNIIIITRKNTFNSWRKELGKFVLLVPYELLSADNLRKVLKQKYWTVTDKTLLIVDELFMFGNVNSQRSKALRTLTHYFKYVIGLSGTIMPTQDNFYIWSQLYALRLDHIVARTATEFRSLYQKTIFSAHTFSGKQWINAEGSREKLLNALKNVAHTYFPINDKEMEIKEQIISVQLTAKQKKLSNQIVEEYRAVLSPEVTFDYTHAIQTIHALLDLTTGIMLTDNEAPKITWLLNLIATITAQETHNKVIVWCSRRRDVEFISSILTSKRIDHINFTSAHQFQEKTWEDAKMRVCLATIASGSGVNYFKDTKYAIYFTLDRNPLNYQQSMGRTDRFGSLHDGAYYYYLIAENGIEKRMLDLLKENIASERSLIQDLMETLKKL